MPLLAIRITVQYTSIHAIINHFAGHFQGSYFITQEHVDSNHHVNICLKTEKSPTTVRNDFVRKLNLPSKCNAYYCKLVKSNWHIYILKECKKQPENMLYNGLYTDDEITKMTETSYVKEDKGFTFKKLIQKYVPIEDWESTKAKNDHIQDYILEYIRGELHDDRTIQRLGNAIASQYYFALYKQKRYFFFEN